MTDHSLNRREFLQTTAAAGAVGAAGITAAGITSPQPAHAATSTPTSKILNYNENMEYRRLGKTELMISTVCMGGHTGRLPDECEEDDRALDKNRSDVISRCIDAGINYIDACCEFEVMYCMRALKGRRDKMYLALSDCEREIRKVDYRTSKKLVETLENLLKQSGQEYTDLWRITCHEPGGRHTFNESCELMDALVKAKEQGKARFIGFSTHDRRWIKMMIQQFPQIDVVLFPYTTMSKNAPRHSLFDDLRKYDVGAFGIKPFAAASMFKGNSQPGNPYEEEDNRQARLALRYIMLNPDIIPIPGLSNVNQVDNVARAVMERRELDLKERAEIEQINKQTLANLPKNYQWLKDWQEV